MAENLPETYAQESLLDVPLSEDVLLHWQRTALELGPDTLANTPIIIHVASPSAGGKRTTIDKVTEKLEAEDTPARIVKSATTRKYRNKDDDRQYELLRYEDGKDLGLEYARSRFFELVERGEIREFASVPSDHGSNYYGLLITEDDLQKPGVTFIESTVASLPSLKYGGTCSGEERQHIVLPIVGVISVYLLPPGKSLPAMLDTLADWMSLRPGETKESVHARIWSDGAATPIELAQIMTGQYPIDHLLVNQPSRREGEYAAAQALFNIIMRYKVAKLAISKAVA